MLLAAITWDRWGDLVATTPGYDLVAAAQGLARRRCPTSTSPTATGRSARCCSAPSSRSSGIAIGPADRARPGARAAACIGADLRRRRACSLPPLPAAARRRARAVPALSSTKHLLRPAAHARRAARRAPGARRGRSPPRATRRPARAAGCAATGAASACACLTRPETLRARGWRCGGWLRSRAARAPAAAPASRARARRRRAGTRGPRCSSALGGYGGLLRHRRGRRPPLTLGCAHPRDLFPAGRCASRCRRRLDVLGAAHAARASPSSPAALALYLPRRARRSSRVGLTLARPRACARRRARRRAAWRRRRPGRARRPPGARPLRPQVRLRLDPGRRAARRAAPGLAASAARRGRGRAPRRSRFLLALLPSAFSYSAYARFCALPEPELPAGDGLRDAGRSRSSSPGCTSASCRGCCRPAPRGAPRRSAGSRCSAVCCLGLLRPRRAQGDRRRPRPATGRWPPTPADGPGLPGRRSTSSCARPAGREPILLAPQMTSLYVLSGPPATRCPSSRCCRARSPTPADERAAIRTHRRRGVRLADHRPRRPLTRYGAGAFGTGYDRADRRLAAQQLHPLTTLRGVGRRRHERTLDVWLRRTP